MPDLPERLNAAVALVDDHLAEDRGPRPAILSGPQSVSYQQLHEAVNRFGNVLYELGVRMEERIALLLPDSPPCAYAFFGAMKIGAVAVPMNTMLSAREYEYMLSDSRARVLVVHAALLDRIEPDSSPGCRTWCMCSWWAASPRNPRRPGAFLLR